jgi:hypothetical protein
MTKSEKETIIRWDEETTKVSIYSCSQSVWTKCRKAGLAEISRTKGIDGKITSKTFEGARKNITIRKLPSAKNLTDSERATLRERMRRVSRDQRAKREEVT